MHKVFSLFLAATIIFSTALPVAAAETASSDFSEYEPEEQVTMPIMEESGNNLWSDRGNYNAGWPGLTDYTNTTEFTITDCYARLDLTGVKDKEAVRYGNLFGLLETSTEQRTAVSNNIFDNHDYLAAAAEIDAPSEGYIGEKLFTLDLAGELDNTAEINLSQNWAILKNILTVGEKAHPLDYIQCAEKTAEVDFYDHWTVDSYEHEHLTQDSDTAQVTFYKDSGEDTFSMDAEITSKNDNPTRRSCMGKTPTLPLGYALRAQTLIILSCSRPLNHTNI